jgi:hypothetical protein
MRDTSAYTICVHYLPMDEFIRQPPKIGKNMIFLRKIVIFLTKYPKNVRASLRSVQFFLSAPPPLT